MKILEKGEVIYVYIIVLRPERESKELELGARSDAVNSRL